MAVKRGECSGSQVSVGSLWRDLCFARLAGGRIAVEVRIFGEFQVDGEPSGAGGVLERVDRRIPFRRTWFLSSMQSRISDASEFFVCSSYFFFVLVVIHLVTSDHGALILGFGSLFVLIGGMKSWHRSFLSSRNIVSKSLLSFLLDRRVSVMAGTDGEVRGFPLERRLLLSRSRRIAR